MKFVMVEWVDSCSDNGWKDRSGKKDKVSVAHILTVGILHAQNKRGISVALSRSCFGHTDDVISIPAGCIKKVTYLK